MQIGSITLMPIDIFFTAVILVMTIKAIVRGFIAEFMGIASVGLGILLGILFASRFGTVLAEKFGLAKWSQVIAFLLIFIVTYLLMKIFENGISSLIDKIHLDKLDRSLGLFFGLLEGFVLVMLVIFVIQVQPLFDTTKLENESFYVQMMRGFFPDGETILDDALNV